MPTTDEREQAKVKFAAKNAARREQPRGPWYREARRARAALGGAFGRLPASLKVTLSLGTSKSNEYSQEAEIERQRSQKASKRTGNTVLDPTLAGKLK